MTKTCADEVAKYLAKEAYVFSYPMIENYKVMYKQAVEGDSFNSFKHDEEPVDHNFELIVTPSVDFLYSQAWLNLRGEPLILRFPAVYERYYMFQFVDMYTHNIAYAGTRETDSEACDILIVGPNSSWNGWIPPGITKVVHTEGDFLFILVRTELFGPDDTENVNEIQKQYQILSFPEMGEKPSKTATRSGMDFPEIDPNEDYLDERFIEYFNFLLKHVNLHFSEEELISKFAPIGVGSGESPPEDLKPCIEEGTKNGFQAILKLINDLPDTDWSTGGLDWFGTRSEMQGKYLIRAAAAMFGLYGNTAVEAFYPETKLDAGRNDLDGESVYTLTFERDSFPPVKALWSVTAYCQHNRLLVPNGCLEMKAGCSGSPPRYAVGSRTGGLYYNEDGSLTIYLQNKEPMDENQKKNWLPTPDKEHPDWEKNVDDTRFYLVMRLYLPGKSAVNPQTPYMPPSVMKNV